MDSNSDYAAFAVVPNVQEIVRGNPLKVPERYLRDRYETACDRSSEIPVVDFFLLSRGHKEELHKLDLACKQWGLFQIVNHGVATQVMQGMKDAAAEFFELPIEEKNKVAKPLDDAQGYGNSNALSEDEILDWHDALVLIVNPTEYRKIAIWPTTPKRFKEIIEAYSSEVMKIGEELMGCLSLLMGMEKDALLGLHQEFLQVLRVNYYPPCSMPDQVLGMTPHSDPTTITILMQEDNVAGLQVVQGGEWVPVNPIPNAFIVNVGDFIEIWSNGKYKSPEHRAVTSGSKVRLSYATGISPHEDVEVEPLDSVLVEARGSLKAAYKKVRCGDYRRQLFEKKIEGKRYIQMVKKGES